jgi:hypothetical protein
VAGPEPYAQEKWTVEQEKAYAEGRASAQSGQGSAPRSGGKGSGRKRYVRTKEGERRYKVPIGSEIGTARNAKAAEAQKDTESTARYDDLVGQDQDAQSKAMRGLSDDQLQRLSRVAYSFRSSDQNVVRLRVGVANELARRGFNVNDFGGLGGGSTRSAGPVSRKQADRAKDRAKAAAAPGSHSTEGIKAAMSRMYGKNRARNLSVPQLRKALGAFGRVAPDKREVVAKYLVGQAIELGMPHMLGRAVVEASGRHQEVIELAGSWKHGWIPLDAAAVSEKMKGKTGGKQWWSGGKGGGKRKSGRKMLTNKDTGDQFAPRNVGSASARRQQREAQRTAPARMKQGQKRIQEGIKKNAGEFKTDSSRDDNIQSMHATGSAELMGSIDKMSPENLRKLRARLVKGRAKMNKPSKVPGVEPAGKAKALAAYDRLISRIDGWLRKKG